MSYYGVISSLLYNYSLNVCLNFITQYKDS